WRKGEDDTKGLAPQDLQKRFYRLLQGLHEFMTEDVILKEDDEGSFLDHEKEEKEKTTGNGTKVKEKIIIEDDPEQTPIEEEEEDELTTNTSKPIEDEL